MDTARAIELLERQISEAMEGFPENFTQWHDRTEVVIRQVFGESSVTYNKFSNVRYSPSVWGPGMDTSGYRPAGVRNVISILEAGKLELELLDDDAPVAEEAGVLAVGTKAFIVHGQDDARKYELESFLQKLLDEPPVILHQLANGGRVLIEKFEQSAASVGFAVVLLTADDFGRSKHLDPQDDLPRARQNVVFELGFFIGLIGRSKVAVLYDNGVELPSDVSGLAYIPLDPAGAWKGKLASEMDHAGMKVDWAALGSV